jgi:hypothetical protein
MQTSGPIVAVTKSHHPTRSTAMTRRIIRTATIAIAIAALAAPTALAHPADPSEAVLKAAAAAEQHSLAQHLPG